METSLLTMQVANLALSLDSRDSDIKLELPVCHEKFLIPNQESGLALQVQCGQAGRSENWRSVFYSPDSWALWIDEKARYVFRPSLKSPPTRYVFVDQDFSLGKVLVEFDHSGSPEDSFYPLVDIDIILYVNWLAKHGDFVVHSAGIDDAGQGYCFIGPSGIGKSTLAGLWLEHSPATVLGDDQAIIRYLDGRFWIFGTPWHTNLARCSPEGVPLTKVFFLRQDAVNSVQPFAPSEVTTALLRTAFLPYYNADGMSKILDSFARLVVQVPFYTLGFRPEPQVLNVIRKI